jgi:SAM-dependent methyltransferase
MKIKRTFLYRTIRKAYKLIFRKPETEIIHISQEEKNKCLDFHINYNGFRTISNCVLITGIEEHKVRNIKESLYKERAIGCYYFEADVPPHKYMRDLIKRKIGDNLSTESLILEIGPGDNPIFPFSDFINWYGVDQNYNGNEINFNGNRWASEKYPSDRIFNGDWENISKIEGLKQFHNKYDLVVASHSYEHVIKPIQSLIEASIMLKPGGYLILFVPDGFSDDPSARDEMTHTIYLVPDMINEFFSYSGKFTDPIIETFRPNADYFIMARKK